MSDRPYFSHVKITTRTDDDRTTRPYIGIFQGRQPVALLDANEALKLSNRLVDLAERLQEEQP